MHTSIVFAAVLLLARARAQFTMNAITQIADGQIQAPTGPQPPVITPTPFTSIPPPTSVVMPPTPETSPSVVVSSIPPVVTYVSTSVTPQTYRNTTTSSFVPPSTVGISTTISSVTTVPKLVSSVTPPPQSSVTLRQPSAPTTSTFTGEAGSNRLAEMKFGMVILGGILALV